MNAAARILLLLAACLAAAPALAQGFPTKPVRLLAIFAAGSTGDVVARVLAPAMSELLGQPMIVENVPGAGGVLAAERVARAAPDGYTLLLSISGTHVMRVWLARSNPFDPVNDFTPITQVGESVTYYVANAQLPVGSLKELIDYAKANPGKIAYGTSGIGSPTHLAGELMAQLAGIEIVHVPYKAVSAALQDAIAGQIPTSFAISGSVWPALRAGKIKVLAVMSNERFSRMPNVPTMAEVIPGFEQVPSWMGFFAPARLPAALEKRLHADAVKALNAPEVKGKLAEGDFQVITNSSPEEFAAKIRRQVELVGRIVKRVGLQPTD